MIEIEKPNITLNEKNDDNTYGKIVVEPLERGYGTTIGNSLRRILLSSLPGAAVTSINIQGVLHEFSTIPGVREDVTEIILNIKNLAAKMNVPGPVQLLIDAKGPKEVTAADIITGGDVEIVNEDLHIATLEEGAELIIEMEMEQGIGLRAIGNEDPVRAYQIEGFDMFEEMIGAIQEDTVKMLMRVRPQEKLQRKQVARITSVSGGDIDSIGGKPKPLVKKEKKVGRNDPCPCGSGKKYKKCCGAKEKE
jgi:hypothetical protein